MALRSVLEDGGSHLQPERPAAGSGSKRRLCPAQVIAEDISTNNGYVELSFRARKLDDKVRAGATWGTREAQPERWCRTQAAACLSLLRVPRSPALRAREGRGQRARLEVQRGCGEQCRPSARGAARVI